MTSGHLIQGRNVHVFKHIDTSMFEIVCGEDVVIEINQELIGATTPDSGRFRELRPRMIEMSCTISGVTTSTNDGDISYFHFLEIDNLIDVQDLEVVYTDNNGTETSIRANFYIESTNINGPADGSSGYEIKLRSWGEYAVTILVDPTDTGDEIFSDSYTVAGGVIQDNDWIGLTSANIHLVCREGSEQLSIGLPYSFDGVTGTITPDAATTIDGQRMYVLWTS
jgi:predicted secreted protein